tara:strand:- start:237 stop:503 length:267 start_codon:yes stop_codon:yes gene_type:complete
MSTYEQKDNTGAMFVNDKKESETHPDRKGSALIGGVDYWVSGWVNTSKIGTKYMSLKFSTKDEQQQAAPQQTAPQAKPVDNFDEDIPF